MSKLKIGQSEYKIFGISFVFTYILLSLPAMLGITVVIDWLPEATMLQKFKGYVVDGLIAKGMMKVMVSGIVGVVLGFLLFLKRKK